MMRGFSFSLGVSCTHCHTASDAKAAPGSQEKVDFASDAKPTKQTARAMLRMVEAINQQYLSSLPTHGTFKVDCVTCHRGIPRPQSINDAMAEEIAGKGAPAAVALYRNLRKQYYGSAAYDFSETPLNRLGEMLSRKENNKGAAAVMELNAEVNAPLSVWGLNVLANAHLDAGDREKAKSDYRQILKLKPGDSWASKQLKELENGK